MRKIAERLIKFSAYSSLILGILFSLGILILIVLIVSGSQGINLSKLFLAILVIIIVAIFVFLFFLGIYEFLRYFIKVEKEVEVLEKETGILSEKEGESNGRK